MMLNFKRIVIVCVLLVTAWLVPEVQLTAALEPQREGDQPLQVVIMDVEPFVIKDGDRLTGFSIDLWQEVADRIGRSYEYVAVTSVGEQLEAVEQGEADIGISAISITAEREKSVDFSHSYYLSGLRIMMVPGGGLDLLEGILNIVPRLLIVVSMLVLIILVFSHLIWLSERRNNPKIPKSYWQGMGESFWYSAATLTTVGYGDITPKSRLGRASGVIWMFVGLFLIASFTASVASQFTIDRLESTVEGVDDLVDIEVGTIQGTTADDFLTLHRIRHTAVTDLDTAVEGLAEGRFDAIVYDEPVLAYYLATSDRGRFELVGPSFDQQNYGIALPQGSKYRKEINIALLEMFEDGTTGELREKWFGEAALKPIAAKPGREARNGA